ncbi:MAG TPA: DUF3048 domain-containing protein, partial [Candidatus Dormibacteraeota bacterium]|nr:DUF3048 domain-containing protein [Candidatus Dormibacteraeota bacterium]
MDRVGRRLRSLSPRARGVLAVGVVLVLAAGATLGFLLSRPARSDLGGRPAVSPRVTALTTGSGAAVSDGDLVPGGTALRLTFNGAMRTASIGLLANQAPLALRWAADGRSADLDVATLALGPVVLAIAPGGRDVRGQPLAAWTLAFSSVFAARSHTVALPAPALVQVPNDASARDQAGLQAAAVVYEYLTEGGITRFTAIFTDAPDTIGPVRSGRLVSFALTRRYGGLLVASGLSEGSAAVLRANPVPHVFDTGGGVLQRTASRPPPNNLMAGGATLQRAVTAASLSPRTPPRASVPILAGPAAAEVTVPEHHAAYAFDPATWTYTRRVDGRTLADAATGQ